VLQNFNGKLADHAKIIIRQWRIIIRTRGQRSFFPEEVAKDEAGCDETARATNRFNFHATGGEVKKCRHHWRSGRQTEQRKFCPSGAEFLTASGQTEQ
jgi:hypothetical protein